MFVGNPQLGSILNQLHDFISTQIPSLAVFNKIRKANLKSTFIIEFDLNFVAVLEELIIVAVFFNTRKMVKSKLKTRPRKSHFSKRSAAQRLRRQREIDAVRHETDESTDILG